MTHRCRVGQHADCFVTPLLARFPDQRERLASECSCGCHRAAGPALVDPDQLTLFQETP